MPIKGLSDKRQRMPRVGTIRLGIKAKNASGQEYPKAVDYFVVKQDESTPQESYEAFHEVYGDEPREITVVFPTDVVQDFADPWYRAYSQTMGLICRGDGDKALARWDPSGDGLRPEGVESGTWANSKTKQWLHQTIPCGGEECPMQQVNPPRCRRTMALQFVLPDVRGIGVWQIMTGSWNSIVNVSSMAESFLESFGRIRGVPFRLCIEPQGVVPPGGVKKKTVWVLNLRQPAVSMNELFAQVARLPERTLMLPPAVDEEPPDDVDVIEVDGQLVNEKTGEIVDDHEKRPEQPCKYCDVLIDVEDEWVQMQHGTKVGQCRGPIEAPVDSSAVERAKLSPWEPSAQPAVGNMSTANELGTPEQDATRASLTSGDSRSRIGLSRTKGGDASAADMIDATGPSTSTTETVSEKISPSPDTTREGGQGSKQSSTSAISSVPTATQKSTPESAGSPTVEASGLNPESAGSSPAPPTKNAPVENRASRDPHSVEKAGSTPAGAPNSAPSAKSLQCSACGATVDLRTTPQDEINSHQRRECVPQGQLSDSESEKYRGWQPTNIGAVLTQAWRLFKMDRPAVEEITGKLSPQMKPDELAVAWEKVFGSKVRS